MADRKVPVVDPRNPGVKAELDRQIDALSDSQATELVFDLDKWAETVDDGRQSDGVLNDRYELCVVEAHDPFNWIVGAYDTQREDFVPAAFLADERRPEIDELARLCARALDVRIISVKPRE